MSRKIAARPKVSPCTTVEWHHVAWRMGFPPCRVSDPFQRRFQWSFSSLKCCTKNWKSVWQIQNFAFMGDGACLNRANKASWPNLIVLRKEKYNQKFYAAYPKFLRVPVKWRTQPYEVLARGEGRRTCYHVSWFHSCLLPSRCSITCNTISVCLCFHTHLWGGMKTDFCLRGFH